LIHATELAEKTIGLYWPHTLQYPITFCGRLIETNRFG